MPTLVTENNEDDMYRDEDDGILDEGYIVKEGSEDEAQNFLVNTVKCKKIPINIDEVDQLSGTTLADQLGKPNKFQQEFE